MKRMVSWYLTRPHQHARSAWKRSNLRSSRTANGNGHYTTDAPTLIICSTFLASILGSVPLGPAPYAEKGSTLNKINWSFWKGVILSDPSLGSTAKNTLDGLRLALKREPLIRLDGSFAKLEPEKLNRVDTITLPDSDLSILGQKTFDGLRSILRRSTKALMRLSVSFVDPRPWKPNDSDRISLRDSGMSSLGKRTFGGIRLTLRR